MKYFILAGEASGDLHSAALASALKDADASAEIQGWGGDEMKNAGVKILKHYRELAFMGFVEVLQHLPEIIRNFRTAKAQITAFKPDALILTDYPGFNLRIAKWAHEQGIPVHYYISPQLWAWKESRVKIIRKYVNQMYVILPFEKAFYAKHGIDVHYVGHPLAQRIANQNQNENENQNVTQKVNSLWSKNDKPSNLAASASGGPESVHHQKRIVLLPGSRRREITYMLPTMLEAVKDLSDYNIYIAGAPSVPPEFYYDFIKNSDIRGVTLTFGYTYTLLSNSFAALCTSGTATLETALFNVPQIVCYKGDTLSYLIARKLVKVPYIAIVNLIAEKALVPELIQNDFSVARLKTELQSILSAERRKTMLADYRQLRERLESSDPAKTVAEYIVASLKTT